MVVICCRCAPQSPLAFGVAIAGVTLVFPKAPRRDGVWLFRSPEADAEEWRQAFRDLLGWTPGWPALTPQQRHQVNEFLARRFGQSSYPLTHPLDPRAPGRQRFTCARCKSESQIGARKLYERVEEALRAGERAIILGR